MKERVERLQKKMQEEGLRACVISDHSAVEYFIGRRFSCGERLIALVVTTEGLPKLVLNELFPMTPQADFELVRYNDTEDGVQVVSQFLSGKVGIDKFWSAGFLIRLMALRPDLEIVDGNLVDRIRSVKDPSEQAKMRQASLNNDKVMARVRSSWNRKSTRHSGNWRTAIRPSTRSSRLRKTAPIRMPCRQIRF